MGAAATGYRASPNRAPDLPSTRNDGCNAADRPRRGKRRAAATGRRGSSPERIVHSPVRSHVTARTCRHSAGAPSRHAVAIDHSPSAGGVTTNWPHDHRGTKPAESRTTSKRGEAPSGANEKQARKSARQDIFMTRNFTRIKIRHTERRMNSLEIRRDEVKDTKSRAQKQTFMFDYAETMYLRRSQRYGKCGGLQIFHRRHAGFRSRSHLLYDRKREYPIEKRRFTGRTHENAGLAVQKKSR